MDRNNAQASENKTILLDAAMSDASLDERRFVYTAACSSPNGRAGLDWGTWQDPQDACREADRIAPDGPRACPAASLGAMSLAFGKPAAPAPHSSHADGNDRAAA